MRKKSKRIAYYISAHGYGHAARSVPVLKKLIPEYNVTIKSEIPAGFFYGYLGEQLEGHENYSLISWQVDSGCAQGSFVYIDSKASFFNLRKFMEGKKDWLAVESRWLKENNIDLIFSDISSLPLLAADRLGIPSLLIANFTWHEIYSGFPEAKANEDLIECLRQAYSVTTLQFLPQCHIINEVTPLQKEIGFIALRGRNVRRDLERFLQRSLEGKTVVFIYLGTVDSTCVQWDRLREIKDCIFITRDALNASFLPGNLYVLDDRFSYPDLVASVDIVCTKAGYSTLAMAFAHGKPVITCGRNDFYEFKAVRNYLQENLLGLIIDTHRFYNCDWAEDIREAKRLVIIGRAPLRGEDEVLRTARDYL